MSQFIIFFNKINNKNLLLSTHKYFLHKTYVILIIYAPGDT